MCGLGILCQTARSYYLFYNHKTPMPHAKVRKDGTKLTHGEWATKNKFRWYTENTIMQVIGDK